MRAAIRSPPPQVVLPPSGHLCTSTHLGTAPTPLAEMGIHRHRRCSLVGHAGGGPLVVTPEAPVALLLLWWWPGYQAPTVPARVQKTACRAPAAAPVGTEAEAYGGYVMIHHVPAGAAASEEP